MKNLNNKHTIKLNQLFAILSFLIIGNLFAQKPLDTLVIEKEYIHSRKAPLKVGKGTFIINKVDSLYLVNQIRFNYYEELRQLVKDDVDKDVENIVLKYEQIVKENDFLFDQLELKCKSQSALYQKTIDELKLSLNETDRTLDLSQRSLENANNAIDLSIKQISSAQKKQFWKNFGLIGGGVSIGLIVGLLIAN